MTTREHGESQQGLAKPDHVCGTPDAMCDTDCMRAAGEWPMCESDCDRMERAAIAIETLTANLDALLAQRDALHAALLNLVSACNKFFGPGKSHKPPTFKGPMEDAQEAIKSVTP
jgi:hypothetical protein